MSRRWPNAQSAILGFCVLRAAVAYAQLLPPSSQPLQSFEVATVRPAQSDHAGVSFQVAPMRFRAEYATLTDLIAFAYDVRSNDQIQKAPRWASAERFDVDAKIDDAEASATKKLSPSRQIDQYRLMLQSLLKERFGLDVHTQMEELSVYVLEVAKGGPKLVAATTPLNLPNLSGWSKGIVDAHAVTMSLLSQGLSGRDDVGGRIVIDGTGLKGSYDFTLQWAPTSFNTSSDAAGESLSTALREQLGLRLTAQKAPARVLIIDHLEHPSPN